VSLDQLRYFVTVAEVGTTRAAAMALHISQPPLSRQIRALEGELGVALFDRSARGMRLRPEGEVFLAHAREILAAVDRAAQATQTVARGSGTDPPD
jgi:DNA-binding transcriptional LysR family regulator